MRNLWLLGVGMMLGCLGLMAGDTLTVCKNTGKIKLDGKLNEPIWSKAQVWKRFTDSRTGKPALAATEIRFLYDNKAIYVGVKAMLLPNAKLLTNDKNLYAGECVEVMLDPGATHNSYFHFMVNPNNAVQDEYREQGGFVGDLKWEAIWESAAYIGKGFWSVELRIPYSSMDFPAGESQVWSFNAARCARGLSPNNAMEDSAATPDGAFHVAGRFPELTGFGNSFAPYSEWQISKPAISIGRQGKALKLATSLSIANSVSKAREVMVSVDMVNADRSESQRRNQRIKIGANASETLKLEGFTFAKAGNFTEEVTLRNPVNKRILKRQRFPLNVRFQALSIHLHEPWYKQAIFASMKLNKVRYQVNAALPEAELKGKTIRSGIRTLEGKVLVSKEASAAEWVSFEFPAAPLPESKMQIFAELLDKNNAKSEDVSLALRKLPHLAGEVWLDRDRTVVVDGKRTFPIIQWTAENDFIDGVDVFLAWQSYRGTRVMSPIFSHNKRMSKIRKGTVVSANDEAYIRSMVAAERDKPETFCYLFCDEPEVFGDTVEAMETMYKIISDEDPYHPALIGNDSTGGMIDFVNTGDLNALHSYPRIKRDKPYAQYGGVFRVMTTYQNALKGRYQQQAAIWNALSFDYTNYAQVGARVPRYLEMRSEYLHAIILGSHGMFIYNSLPEHYPEIGIGTVQCMREIKSYAEFLAQPEVKNGVACNIAGIAGTVREKNGELLLIVGNLTDKELKNVRFTVPPLKARELTVMTEDRKIQPQENAVIDTFAPYDVHVYRTGNPARLMSRKEIVKAIDETNAKRRKPGNLAFQMFEGETVNVSASSNRAFNIRPDNALWHVADGVIEPENFKRYNDQLVVWEDATPNVVPDWIALTFPKPVKMGKVIVYPIQDSLQDYEIQVWQAGAWKTVAKAIEASGPAQIHTFPVTTTDKVRIFITKTRLKTARITEIEVYEK